MAKGCIGPATMAIGGPMAARLGIDSGGENFCAGHILLAAAIATQQKAQLLAVVCCKAEKGDRCSSGQVICEKGIGR